MFFSTGRVPPIEHGACLIAHEWAHRPGAAADATGKAVVAGEV